MTLPNKCPVCAEGCEDCKAQNAEAKLELVPGRATKCVDVMQFAPVGGGMYAMVICSCCGCVYAMAVS